LPASGVVRRIEFAGLRRIAAAALLVKIQSKPGQPLDPRKIAEDLRALEALGWFDSISVEVEEIPLLLAEAMPGAHPAGVLSDESQTIGAGSEPLLRVLFVVQERPFLARVEFRGSRLFPEARIRELLAEEQIELKPARPRDPNQLWQAKRAILRALAEQGHGLAQVQIREAAAPTAAVRVRFEIHDGPRVPVESVRFAGAQAMSADDLESQMENIAPHALLAGVRGKDVYTPERLRADIEKLEAYYRNHGHLEVRIGEPTVELVEGTAKSFAGWRTRKTAAYRISLPVSEGPSYRLVAASISGRVPELDSVTEKRLNRLEQQIFSREKTESVAERIRQAALKSADDSRRPVVDIRYQPDRTAATLRVDFVVREVPRFTLRKIEFTGNQRFGDKYFRRRIPLREGDYLDEERLERGLARISRTGFFKRIEASDVHFVLDAERQLADLTLRVHELGRQRLSFSGAPSGMRSTFGLAYTVFDLLGGEEFIASRFDYGPESLSVALGVAKEGLFGSPATLGLNVYQNVLRPWIVTNTGRQRLFRASTQGASFVADFPVGERDAVSLTYSASRTATSIRLAEPVVLRGSVLREVRTDSTRSALAAAWNHQQPGTISGIRIEAAGGPLGGSENTLNAVLSYSRTVEDSLTRGRNSWSFRAFLSGATTYGGQDLPLTSRLYPGEEFLRGFRSGELSPFAVFAPAASAGAEAARVASQGANLFNAFNLEYRMPLEKRVELAAFFDAGASWALPSWLGANAAPILRGTNGVLRASTGLELRFKLPVIQQPLRFFYAVNPLRLAGVFLLPDGTRFRPTDRRGAFGWALGMVF